MTTDIKQTPITIQGIPVIVYGEPSQRVYLYIHGKLGHKEEALAFAAIACPKGWQVLSIDLPGHGQRKAQTDCFDPWHVLPELTLIMAHAKSQWPCIRLYANSIGAWFSLLAFSGEVFEQCLFVSPVVNMQLLIETMMQWAGVTPEQLRQAGSIPTEFGETLSWQYYTYTKENPICNWSSPTSILYAGKDNLTDRSVIEAFAKRFGCKLTVMEQGEHWFHTPEQLAVLNHWAGDAFA